MSSGGLCREPPRSLRGTQSPKQRRRTQAPTLDNITTCKKESFQSAISSLKNEVIELRSKFDSVTNEKNQLENALGKVQASSTEREAESNTKIESLSLRYEEQLTELHSVIAELSSRTEPASRRRSGVILEEDEYDEELEAESRAHTMSEFSQDHIEYTGTDCSTTSERSCSSLTQGRKNEDVSTSCEIDDRAVEAGRCIADLDISVHKRKTPNNLPEEPDDLEDQGYDGEHLKSEQSVRNNGPTPSSFGLDHNAMDSSSYSIGSTPNTPLKGDNQNSCNSTEVARLTAEKDSLVKSLCDSRRNAEIQQAKIGMLSSERERLRKKLLEYQNMQPAQAVSTTLISDAITIRGLRGSPIPGVVLLPSQMENRVHTRGPSPVASSSANNEGSSRTTSPANDENSVRVCKMAEKVRLRKTSSGNHRVTGTDLTSIGLWTTGVAEQVTSAVSEDSDAMELLNTLVTAGGSLAPHDRLRECELEAERLHARIDHLRATNDVLIATLAESKASCDHLSLLNGTVEAKSGALRLTLGVEDKIVEGFEVLTTLQENEICILAASLRGVGVDVQATLKGCDHMVDEDPLLAVRRAQEQRRTTENVARHLLSRLESDLKLDLDLHDKEAGDVRLLPEDQIREAIQQMQDQRRRLTSSVSDNCSMSPCHTSVSPFPHAKFPLTEEEASKLDLENAVLMQELTAIREDRADLRAQVYLLEREKLGLELRVGTYEAQSDVFKVTIDHLKTELEQAKRTAASDQTERGGVTVGDSGISSTSSGDLVATRETAESREEEMKGRIQSLMETLEKISKNSEARHNHQYQFICDLKKANRALLTAVDRLKKKCILQKAVIKELQLMRGGCIKQISSDTN